MDLSRLDNNQLKSLLANARRLKVTEETLRVIREMHRRGLGTNREYAALPWNQDRVDDALAPFAKMAETVRDNERVTYTRAGGNHTHRPKDDPEYRWIESYSGIRVSGVVNAVFAGEIKHPGDDPAFVLYFNEDAEMRHEPKSFRTFAADQLPDALTEWKRVADRAAANSPGESN